MRSYFHLVKRWDIIIIVLLVFLSFLPSAIFTYQQTGKASVNSQNIAVIYVDNKEVKRFTLTDNTTNELFEIRSSDHDSNLIEIKDHKIRIKSATCDDQVCVRMGYISKPGQTIVCLPHKILIEIFSEDGEAEDIIISS